MGNPAASEEALEQLRGKVLGDVICRDDAGFAEVAKACTFSAPWAETKPAVIVRPRGTLDVVTAVKFAKEQGLPLAVRGGGHAAAMLALAENGVTLDLGLMRGVFVNPDNKTVTAEGGCLLGDVDSETSLYKLAVPMGHVQDTGMGLALNGGIGIACRTLDSTCRNIISVQMVTAEGEVVFVDKDNHADLFWGLRGAGSAFGVATKITFKLHDVSSFYGGSLMWKDDPEHQNFRVIARFMRDVADDNYAMNLASACHPQAGPILISMVSYLGTEKSDEQKRQYMEPLLALNPMQTTVGKSTYYDMQCTMSPLIAEMPKPHYDYWAQGTAPRERVDEKFLDKFAGLLDSMPMDKAPLSLVVFDMWGGKMKQHDGPLGYTDDHGFMIILSWMDPRYNGEMQAFARRAKAQLGQECGANLDTYSNATMGLTILGEEEETKVIARAGGLKNVERLRALKKAWDPDNLFSSHPFTGL